MKLMLILLYKQYLHLIQCLHKFPFRLSSTQALLRRNGNNLIYLILELRRNGNKPIWHPSTVTHWNVSLAGKQLLKKLLITWTAARLRKVDMLAEKNGHIVSCFSASHQNIIGICFWLSPKKSH